MQNAVIQLCDPLKSYFSDGAAQLGLGETGAFYERRVIMLEAFSRPLWGLSPLTAGGRDYDIWDIYIKGIVNGTNPSHEEYWRAFGIRAMRQMKEW